MFCPHVRYSSGQHAGNNLFQIQRHYYQTYKKQPTEQRTGANLGGEPQRNNRTFNCFLDVPQTAPDGSRELIKPSHFLHQNRIHALRVRGGVLLHSGVQIEIGRKFRQNIGGHLQNNFVRRFRGPLRRHRVLNRTIRKINFNTEKVFVSTANVSFSNRTHPALHQILVSAVKKKGSLNKKNRSKKKQETDNNIKVAARFPCFDIALLTTLSCCE